MGRRGHAAPLLPSLTLRQSLRRTSAIVERYVKGALPNEGPRVLLWGHANAARRGTIVPRISEFLGIVIYVYWRDHGPPHFHAVYGDDEAIIAIENLSVLEGKLSPRVLGLVVEWATLHQGELRNVWQQALRFEPLSKIEPLR